MNGRGGYIFSDVHANGVNGQSSFEVVSGLSFSLTAYEIVFPSEK
jgi:hypothetical protein